MLDPIPSIRLRTVFGAAASALLVIGLVAGCGGGGGGSNDGSATATPASYSQGPISGFGSIIVNGVRFDNSAATVSDEEGADAPASALKLGTTVEIEGSEIDDAHATAQALHIRFGSEIVGPVDSVDATASTLAVLGQTVEVKPQTVFGDGLAGGLAALSAGTVVEVNALFNAATGHYVATRIEADPAAAVFKLRGLVANLDTSVKTFTIGAATISYANVAASDLPKDLANGLRVRVRLQTVQVGGQWVAVSVHTGVRKVEDHDRAHLHGLITSFTSATQFSVDGTSVDASHAAFPQGTSDLALGVEVEVQGRLVDGSVIANRVELESHARLDHPLELHGTISALDTTAQTFMLRGVTVSYAGTVSFQGGTALDLANGRRIEVQGTLSADHLQLVASKIEFES